MNNKIIARIMATVICVCMMSTVAFAADAVVAPNLGSVEGDATTKVINFMNGDTNILAPEGDADQVTMMAYLVDGTPDLATVSYDSATMTIIAIDQYDANDLATNVKVLASKLVEGKSIVLQTGDSLGGGAKYLVAEEVIEDDKVVTVTVMNGSAEITVEADATGNVTLPVDTAFNKTVNTGYTFTLYSWVTADGTKEYKVADAPKVAATELEDVTLYAKYVTNIVIGDTNGSGAIEPIDRTFLHAYIGSSAVSKLGKMGQSFADLTGIDDLAGIVGDTNGSGAIEPIDRTFLHAYIGSSAVSKLGKMGQAVYYVNK